MSSENKKDLGRFWQPLWRRILVLIVAGVWLIVELRQGSFFWAAFGGILMVLSAYEFFLSGQYKDGQFTRADPDEAP